MTPEQREDQAIERWCIVLSRIEGVRVEVTERPDRARPGTGGCDAIVRRCGDMHAVEHTTIDPYESRRADDHRFRTVIVPLERAVEQSVADSWIEIEVAAHAIPTGENWSEMSTRLSTRVIEAVASMPVAPYYDLTRTRFDWDDILFPVWISRQAAEGDARCLVMRQKPLDMDEQLVADIERALTDKSAQLRAYRDSAMRTVLLLDFDDVVLLSRNIVANAFTRAAERQAAAIATIDEVYQIESGRKPPFIYPIKLRDRMYPELPEFRQFFTDQYNNR